MRRAAAALALIVLALTGCGGDDEGTLTVSAAASLRQPFTTYGDGFEAATVRLSFGGSDELAAQIRQGVRPDVFAAADTRLPDALHAEGLVERPVVFAANRLVVAVPSGSGIDSLDDLAGRDVKLAIGSESVPIGVYTRAVLGRLEADERDAILANVRSEEPDANGIVGKAVQGAVDAGFVYATDVAAADGRLRAVEIPRRLQPDVGYAAAVVKGARNREAARRFLGGLANGNGARALRDAGFEPPR